MGTIVAEWFITAMVHEGRFDVVERRVLEKILKNFPLEGYVINRSGDSLTLDLGVRTWVKTGMRFIVFKEGQIFKHPKTGEVLDVERIETGKVTITSVAQ